ncbi:target of myb1 related tom1 [Echinococcus multilocularis]|uniref:Target of myb1 related tom1 n=1 Tax=Echinococcus multilocularis TaxID=6211 RepID=A0A087VY76_ECHMU|nr:target of myb1 related tom1 [Echinococcus multilocularis]
MELAEFRVICMRSGSRKSQESLEKRYSHLATRIHNPTPNPNSSPFFLFLIPAVAADACACDPQLSYIHSNSTIGGGERKECQEVFFATAPRTFLNHHHHHHQQQQQQQQQHRYQHQQYESSQQLQQASSTTHHSMPSGMYSLSGDQTLVDHEGTVRRLSTAQRERLSQDLTVVQTNLHILNDMLTELQPDAISPDDLELLQELNETCRMMQQRVAEFLSQVADDAVTLTLIQLNDELNSAFQRLAKNMSSDISLLSTPLWPNDTSDIPFLLACLPSVGRHERFKRHRLRALRAQIANRDVGQSRAALPSTEMVPSQQLQLQLLTTKHIGSSCSNVTTLI